MTVDGSGDNSGDETPPGEGLPPGGSTTPAQPSGNEVITPDVVDSKLNLKSAAGSVTGKPPPQTYIEGSIVHMTWGMGAVTVLMAVFVFCDFVYHAPGTLTPADLQGKAATLSENAEKAKLMIENHRALSEIYIDRSMKLFDGLIGKAFLPIVTALIGYLIGTRKGRDAN